MLKFPTQAEQAVTKFRESKVTVSLVSICDVMGAQRSPRRWHEGRTLIEYTFDDDSALQITGRGLAHRVETLLP